MLCCDVLFTRVDLGVMRDKAAAGREVLLVEMACSCLCVSSLALDALCV